MTRIPTNIVSDPGRIFKDAESVDDKLYRLADVFSDCREWRLEESDLLAALTTRIRILEAEVRALKEGV